MDLFISWSGHTSKKIAEALREWIPCVIQAIQPYYTPDDIAKGDRWSGEIASKLESSQIGIVVLTPENLEAPWLMFEAGALSKNLGSSSVCPILFGVTPTDIKGPLLQFQCSNFSVEEIKKLIETINNKLGNNKLDSKTLSTTFQVWWTKLEEKVVEILNEAGSSATDPSSVRTDRDILEELLRLSRKSVYRYAKHTGDNDIRTLWDSKPVTFNPETGVVSFWEHRKEVYEFTVDRLSSGSEVLDWILQVSRKGWCTDRHLKAFISCIEELCDCYFKMNAQGVFCPGGSNKEVDWDQTLTNKSTGQSNCR